ncbi:hypothetical protein I3760_14G130200 [Carya illinoinensis]|nr:hypothetical protein I3760_14G130200 [Carya illinoinensis]
MIMAIYSCWASPPTGLFPFGQEALRNLMKTNGAWTYRKRGMGNGKEQPSTQTSSSSNPSSVVCYIIYCFVFMSIYHQGVPQSTAFELLDPNSEKR